MHRVTISCNGIMNLAKLDCELTHFKGVMKS